MRDFSCIKPTISPAILMAISLQFRTMLSSLYIERVTALEQKQQLGGFKFEVTTQGLCFQCRMPLPSLGIDYGTVLEK